MNHYFKMHDGVDIGGPSNEPVFATGDGKVVEVGFNFFGYGNFVVIDHGFGYRTLYGHLRAAFVSQGQMLHRGDEVGQMGNTGRPTGTHLHYEVQYKGHPINPVNFYDNTISPEEYAKLVKPLK
jgi:murein DD-endopeptidase MepM/ murein hydrolase activator NlpD